MVERYNHLNKYLKNKFGERVLKICIDGGFTCPNRDGTKGYGGCIFCSEDGAGENIKGKCQFPLDSIKNQITTFLDSYRGTRANKFIAYFQSFSNTYDTLQNLKSKYDLALSVSDKIIGLEIATRPDLIDENIVKLLKSYKDKYYVCVELGFQTANSDIGNYINLKYSKDDFVKACKLLRDNDIFVVAHMMIGLPYETNNDIKETLEIINACDCNGIKIHSTYILKNTKLNLDFNEGKYKPISLDYYVNIVAKIISNLNKSIIVHRINADPPKNILVSPEWMTKKKIVINSINNKLEDLDVVQGDRKLCF